MKKVIRIIIIAAFFFTALPIFAKTDTLENAINSAANEISRKIENKTNAIAVLDIQSDYTKLSEFIVEQLVYELTNILEPKQITVTERNERSLALIQKETDYQYSGAVSDDTIQDIGQDLGADSIVLGKIGRFGNEWILNLNVVTVKNKTQLATSRQKISKNDEKIKYFEKEYEESGYLSQSSWGKSSKKTSSPTWNSENKTALTFVALGLNVPFNISSDSDVTLNDNTFPYGISAHLQSSYMYISFKGNINFDFVKYSEKTSTLVGANLSLGASPIHNDYLFVGLYGTLGFDEINKYSYIAYGGSAYIGFNFSEKLGLFFNLDVTRRSSEQYNGDEEEPPYDPLFIDSWRICPSIGLSYTFSGISF